MSPLDSKIRGGGIMSRLRPEERVLLDLLCLTAPMSAELDRAFRLRVGWGASIDALRHRGLVAMDSLRPSQSALAAWVDRRTGCQEAASQPAIAEPSTQGRPAKAPDWSPAEDDRLREAYANGENIEAVAEELGRTVSGARSRADKIGLAGSHAAGRGGWATEPDWTEVEDDRLRRDYGGIPTTRLAAELGRTKSAVFNRAFVLGLKHGYHRDWSHEEREALRIAFDRGIALIDLAVALDRKYGAVAKFAANHGYKFGSRPRLRTSLDLESILALESASPPELVFARSGPAAKVRPGNGWRDPVRQDRFIEALERIGRHTLALKEIGMGAGNAQVLKQARRRDPDFDRRCNLAQSAWALRSDTVRAIAAFARAAMTRPKSKTDPVWDTPERQDAFVGACRTEGSIAAALRSMGMSVSNSRSVKAAGERSPGFAERIDEALRAHMAAKAAARRSERRVRASRPAHRNREPAVNLVPAMRPESGAGRKLGAGDEGGRAAGCKPCAGDEGGRVTGETARAIVGRASIFAPNFTRPVAETPRRRKSDAEISAENLRYQQERELIAQEAKRHFTVDEAKLELQRRGFSVVRASIFGGRAYRWSVGTKGKDFTDEQLVAMAERRAYA